MRGFRCGAIVFAVLLGWSCGDRSARATVVMVTDQSVYNQDTSGLTTIDFNAFVPAGQDLADYSTSTGLVSGPVDFVGQLTSGGTNFLYAVTPAYYSAYNAYPNSPTVLSGPPGGYEEYYAYSGTLNVTLGGSYSAVGSGFYVVQAGDGGAVSGSVSIAVTDLSGTYDFTFTTSGTAIDFLGFLSNSRITSIQYTAEGGTTFQQFPELSNFSYGINASAVPEPSGLVLAASGASVLLAFLALRR